jgi:hypothetical protein
VNEHAYEPFEMWPQRVGPVAVEPASGTVRMLRRRKPPLELLSSEARLLARAASDRVAATLLAAAQEADRQAAELRLAMEAPA